MRSTPPLFWVGLGIVAFAFTAILLSTLRYAEFHTNALDLGLYQQALWSRAHGGPFYEAPDFESAGYRSFFQVHLAFPLYLVAPLYGTAPSAVTLFAFQSALVAFAAIPLYLLGRDVPGGTPKRGAVVAILYLAWAPLLGATLFDFHVEAFVPILLFTLAWLCETRRYLPAIVTAVASVLAAEFVGILVAALGVFMAIRDFKLAPVAHPLRRVSDSIAAWVRSRDTWAGFLLAAFGAIAFVALVEFQAYDVPAFFGFAGSPTASQNATAVLTGVPSFFGWSPSNLDVNFWTKLTMWVAPYVLVAGIPLFALRTQVVAIPWLVFSVLVPINNFVLIGFQYGFLLAVPVFLGTAYGLPRAIEAFRRATETQAGPVATEPATPSLPDPRFRRGTTWGVGLLVVLIAANLLVSPVDPLMQSTPGFGAGYFVSYSQPNTLGDATAMVGLIPTDAPVLASDNLFPLVANDPNAYVLLAGNYLDYHHLPFNATNPPTYVLLAENRLSLVPPWVSDRLYNGSQYALLGVTWGTPAGALVLFGPGAIGPVRFYGPAPATSQSFFASALQPGGIARLYDAGHPAASEIGNLPGFTGTLWTGPRLDLPAGVYRADVTVQCSLWGTSPPPSSATPTLQLRLGAFGQGPWIKETERWGAFPLGQWVTLRLNFTVPNASIDAELSGSLLSASAQMYVSAVTISQTGAG